MAVQRHKISLQVSKNISGVRSPFKLFYELKFKNAAERGFVFVECYIVKLL